MPISRIMEIQLSIKGRPLRTFRLAEGSIVAGRDPDTGIYLDNVGVSRHHAKFEKTAEGYFVEDLSSANGTFLNNNPVKRAMLKDRDVIRIGKFSLWIAMVPDGRAIAQPSAKQVSPMAFQGTTVLKTDEITQILDASKKTEATSPFLGVAEESQPESKPSLAPMLSTALPAFGIALAFCIGAVVGGVITWLLLQ